MELDGVGGVSILAKARVFRAGVHFPAFSFERHAETEGFGKMAKRMKFSVVGLPHYTVWHLYEPSVDDIRHMEEMEREKREREKQEKEKVEQSKKLEDEFKLVGSQWEKDKEAIKAGKGSEEGPKNADPAEKDGATAKDKTPAKGA
jgi:mannan polymerase II complex ANP1 subunit